MDVRAEMNKELKRARRWLLAVGIVVFVLELIGVLTARIDSRGKVVGSIFCAVLLSAFLALWWFARRKPRLCLSLGLALYWALVIWEAVIDPATLLGGIILKVLFTSALIQGIRSAGRVELLRDQVVEVFE